MLTTATRRAAVPTVRMGLVHWATRTADRYRVQLPQLHLRRLTRPDRLLRLAANVAVVGLVLILPFASTSAQTTPLVASESYGAEAPRAELSSRGLIANGRSPITALAEGTQPVQSYTIGKDDTLSSIANFYKLSPEAVAFANGITDPLSLKVGSSILIPPAEGALYSVSEGDTVEGVATRFKVEPAVIMSYNRLYFEPEHFAPGQLIFVRNAEFPGLVYQTVAVAAPAPPRAAPAIIRTPQQTVQTGRLAWPVGGRITQRFRPGHSGTDIAAPYGTGIAVPMAGTVVSTGWVAVGGLSVRVRHDDGMVTGYYHMSAVYVANGQRVSAAQVVGAIGLTGVTTGPHVHWECQVGSVLVDCLAQ